MPVPDIERPFGVPEMVPILLLKRLNELVVRSHVAVREAYGILNVCVEPVEEILNVVPLFPMANV